MTATIQISETEPTALLKDFSEFTAYLTHHPVILATAREFIGGRDLCALNEAMSEPVPETTTRTRQTLYPQLHLFYYLALAGELFHKVPGKGGKLILEATDRLAQYEELKLTERYFFLLETFWVDCDWKKLQSGHGVRLDPPYEVPPVMELLGEPAAAKKKRQRLLYLFDYGDEWLFQIAVEAIRKSGARPRKPKVVGQKGKAPEQYEYY